MSDLLDEAHEFLLCMDKMEYADALFALRAELTEARRVIDEARNIASEYLTARSACDVPHGHGLPKPRRYNEPEIVRYREAITALTNFALAAIVPQPAVPEAVARGVLCVECGGQGQYWIGEPSDPVAAQCDACGGTGMVSVSVIISQMESVGAGGASHHYVTGWARDLRAILSATDSEVKKDVE